jgi:hypothetical protein
MPHDNSKHFLVMIIEKFRFFLLRMYSFDENEKIVIFLLKVDFNDLWWINGSLWYTLLLFKGIEGIPMCALFFPLEFEGKIH